MYRRRFVWRESDQSESERCAAERRNNNAKWPKIQVICVEEAKRTPSSLSSCESLSDIKGAIYMMKNINGKTLKIVLIMSFYIWSMVAVAAAAEDTTSEEPIIAMTIKADASGAVSEVLPVAIKAGEFFKVQLSAASGTGYEWVLLNKDLRLIEVINRSTDPTTDPPDVPGAKMCTVYILQAKPDTAGQETITFSLRQGWQLANMAAKTINCEVKVTKE